MANGELRMGKQHAACAAPLSHSPFAISHSQTDIRQSPIASR
jgi:hypothetical protein